MRTQATVAPQAYSIAEFCAAHSISRGMYYILDAEGKAPTTMRVGRRRLISVEEAARWRERMMGGPQSAAAA